MFRLDDELIKDRFLSTSFSFYTNDEISKLSVKQILNPNAFDHLGNPTSGGIYDKALGVSPFDHRA
jgi:DNA-directed RNA polymerase I subunit RPA1